ENNGTKYMEQTRPQLAIRPDIWPTLTAGDPEWQDYTLEAVVRPLSTRSHTGLLCRYVHSRKHYFFGFEGGKVRLIKRDQDEFSELAAIDFDYDTDHYYNLRIECDGSRLTGIVDGREVFSVEDSSYRKGKIALTARMPAQFTEVTVSMTTRQHEMWLN